MNPPRSINVGWRGDHCPLLRFHLVGHGHEWRGMSLVVILPDLLLQHGWCEGAKRFTSLDAPIQNVFHIVPPGIGENAPLAKRAGSQFHPSLKPADDVSRGNHLRCVTAELFLAGALSDFPL